VLVNVELYEAGVVRYGGVGLALGDDPDSGRQACGSKSGSHRSALDRVVCNCPTACWTIGIREGGAVVQQVLQNWSAEIREAFMVLGFATFVELRMRVFQSRSYLGCMPTNKITKRVLYTGARCPPTAAASL